MIALDVEVYYLDGVEEKTPNKFENVEELNDSKDYLILKSRTEEIYLKKSLIAVFRIIYKK